MNSEFYNYMRNREKPRKRKLLEQQFSLCYKEIKNIHPQDKDYLSLIESKTKELDTLKQQIQECGGTVVGSVVVFSTRMKKKSVKNKK